MSTSVETCPDCGCRDFFLNREKGEAICRNCSYVIDEAIDFGRDSRAFDEDEQLENSRTGAPFDPRIANNLATTIGSNADLSKLTGRNKALIHRIRKRQSWASTSFEHSLNTALSHMRLISGRLELPSIVEKEAAVIYRQAAERGLTLKRAIEDIVAAALFIACKMHGIPRAMKELATESKTDLKILGKTYKLLLRTLNIKIMPTSPVDYVSKFASALTLSPKVQTRAVKLIEQLDKGGHLSGLSPLSVAASTLYIACLLEKEKRTQKEVAETTGITEATLRARCRDICKKIGVKIKVR